VHTVEAGKRIALKNILFATDFSPCSNAALPYALAVARRYGTTLHAAYVKPNEAEMLFMSPESWPAVAEEEDKRIQAYIEQLEKQCQGLPHDVLRMHSPRLSKNVRLICSCSALMDARAFANC